jgi:NAD+ diphosphatase
MLVKATGGVIAVPLISTPAEIGLSTTCHHYIGTLDGCDCFSAELSDTCDAPEGTLFQGLWKLYGRLEEDLYKIAVRAVQIAYWDRTHRFCGKCGEQTTDREDIRAKECPKCGFIMFPRISPAVIVLVEHDEGMVLLARAKRFQGNLYSVLAGFVEPGETLEEAVQREIKEEVGIDVKGMRYFGSQPWPFPDSLMIAFIASYAGGEIKVDGEEIADARWFKAGDLPEIPGNISIARKLIDRFTTEHTKI